MVPQKAPPVLVLCKTEWDRLKRAAEPPQPPSVEKSDYLQKLNEKSREWIKTWPDSMEGVVAKVTKVREKKRQKEREMVTKYNEIERLRTLIDHKVVEEAKQKIFNNSCFGKQLISALLESKAIEEREAQIEFNKKRKEEALQLSKKEEFMNTLQVGLEDEEKILKRKQTDKKLAEEYKAVVEETKRKQAEEREKEIIGDLEDARLMKQLLDIEPHDMEHCKLRAIEAARSHMEEQKYYRKLKEIRNKEDDALVQIWNKYHERVRFREQKVMDKIHKARNDIPNLKLTYQILEKLNDEEQKRYDEFVQKGVDKLDKRIIEKDQKEEMKQRKIKEQYLQYAKDNKIQGELLKSYCQVNKCICEKQTLAMNTHPKYEKKNVEINKKESKRSFTNSNNVVEESKECKSDHKACTCNSKKECSEMKFSFSNAILAPKLGLMKTSRSNVMTSMLSSKQTPYSSQSFASIETSYSYKYMETTPPTADSLLVTPSSLQTSSETPSSKYKIEDKWSQETKEGAGPSFLKPMNKLIESLKAREKEPTPWTGSKGSHEYFASQASEVLKECRYKKMAQKVVNDYKKVNCLATLPISNWN